MKIIISIGVVIVVVVLGAVSYLWKREEVATPSAQITVPEVSGKSVTIVAFGDSLTAGYGLTTTESYPAQLEKKLREHGYDVKVINSGVSGETTEVALLRADFIRAQNPDIVILGIGGNDALRFVPIEETRSNMERILSTLLEGGDAPRVLLLRMQAPSNAGIAYKTAFDSLYVSLASKFNIELVQFVVAEVFRNPEFLQADGIHPTKEGYTVLVDSYILPAVETYLKE